MTIVLIIIILALGIALFIVLNQSKKAKTKLNSEIDNKSSELTAKFEENNKLNSDLQRFSGVVSIEKEVELKNEELSAIQLSASELNGKFIDENQFIKN